MNIAWSESLRSFTLQITPVQAKQELKIIYANQPAELLGGSSDKNQAASVAFQARNAIPCFAWLHETESGEPSHILLPEPARADQHAEEEV